MAREVDIQLMQYRGMQDWKPRVGDVIIRHGWIVRTKWFGVVNFIRPDGVLDVIKDGMPRLLVTTPADLMRSKTSDVNPGIIKSSTPGSYTIMQQDSSSGMVVWYV